MKRLGMTADIANFVRALLAFGASELVSKVSRFFVILVVAYAMTPEAIGLAAAAMATGEILKAFCEAGVCQRIVAAREDELDNCCHTGHRLIWTWCGGVSALQLVVAGLYVWISADVAVGALIALLAFEHLFVPAGVVSAALAMREGRLTGVAVVTAAQVVCQNVLTIVLVLVFPTPLALVAPKLLAAPVWLVGMRRLRPWRPRRGPATKTRAFVSFGAPFLGAEVIKALRLHADKLVVGAMLGPEALGVYFFAYNAGFGVANSISQAFSLALYPRLCTASDRAGAFMVSMKIALVFLAPVVLLQAALAPVYVPLLFGEKWAPWAHLVALSCLMAAPGVLWAGAAQRLRAERQVDRELLATATLMVALVASTALTAPYGLTALASVQCATTTVVQLVATALVLNSTWRASRRQLVEA